MVQSQESSAVTIGKLAAAGGVGVETVRYYQRLGLLGTPGRDGGVRRYGPEDVRRLRFIRQAQAAGFALSEIRELLALDATHDRTRARALAKARIAALDARISEMQEARDALERLAGVCGEGREGPCPILVAFEGDTSAAAVAAGRAGA
jgi:MerR family mercuric resistance operon transcriptional regulator